jgi:hypothetical protein
LKKPQRPWLDEDDTKLIQLINDNISQFSLSKIFEMASKPEVLDRGADAIRIHYYKLKSLIDEKNKESNLENTTIESNDNSLISDDVEHEESKVAATDTSIKDIINELSVALNLIFDRVNTEKQEMQNKLDVLDAERKELKKELHNLLRYIKMASNQVMLDEVGVEKFESTVFKMDVNGNLERKV